MEHEACSPVSACSAVQGLTLTIWESGQAMREFAANSRVCRSRTDSILLSFSGGAECPNLRLRAARPGSQRRACFAYEATPRRPSALPPMRSEPRDTWAKGREACASAHGIDPTAQAHPVLSGNDPLACGNRLALNKADTALTRARGRCGAKRMTPANRRRRGLPTLVGARHARYTARAPQAIGSQLGEGHVHDRRTGVVVA